jgi:predicted metal-dependent HD superfamily phosphohydrolase
MTQATDTPGELLDRWHVLAGGGAVADALGRELVARWSEPHRRYHDPVHLARVLDGVDELAAEARDADAVRFAAWFHDAVYGVADGSPVSNEEASALLAQERLPALGIAAERVAEVARLVRLTEGHRTAPGDRDGEVLCDADLAVLGGGPEEYARYTAAIRAEYAEVPDELFRPGRAAVLRGLLELPRLFRTETARARYEARARANLAAEIGELEG